MSHLSSFSFRAVIQPLGNIVSAFGPDGAINTDAGEIPFWGMIGAFCLFINGITAVFTGYMACVHDFSHRYITTFSMVIIQVSLLLQIALGDGSTLFLCWMMALLNLLFCVYRRPLFPT